MSTTSPRAVRRPSHREHDRARPQRRSGRTVSRFPRADLDDLQARLDRTLWPDELPGTDGSYGMTNARVRALADYWRTEFDWRAFEARLNAYPQFLTEIDGQDIHFLHVRSSRPDATPLIVMHGWPGSIVEFLDLIAPLTEPASADDPAFHLVIPSLPGFGFGGPTREAGWNHHRTARAFVELMHRLGYDRYAAAGNDGGSIIAPEMSRIDAEHVIGVHVTQLFSFPSGDPAEFASFTPADYAALQKLQWFYENMFSFNTLHSQQPQTLAFAISDSPVGLLAWNAQLMGESLDAEFVVSNVAIYWLTRTAASAIRFYYEDAHASEKSGRANDGADRTGHVRRRLRVDPAAGRARPRQHRELARVRRESSGGWPAQRRRPLRRARSDGSARPRHAGVLRGAHLSGSRLSPLRRANRHRVRAGGRGDTGVTLRGPGAVGMHPRHARKVTTCLGRSGAFLDREAETGSRVARPEKPGHRVDQTSVARPRIVGGRLQLLLVLLGQRRLQKLTAVLPVHFRHDLVHGRAADEQDQCGVPRRELVSQPLQEVVVDAGVDRRARRPLRSRHRSPCPATARRTADRSGHPIAHRQRRRGRPYSRWSDEV